jgi:dCMP deaminase
MHLAIAACTRSSDARTKHAAIFVGPDNHFISFGYNNPPTNMNDLEIGADPSQKYEIMIHAESNAIINAAKIGAPIRGSTCYLTGKSCHKCIGLLANCGCKRVVYGPIWSVCVTTNPQFDKIHDDIVKNNNIQIDQFDRIEELLSLMSDTQNYLKEKLKTH